VKPLLHETRIAKACELSRPSQFDE
jgi:hypothetical protein